MIGKIIADASGLTDKWGGQKNEKYKEIHKIDYKVDDSKWDKFQAEVKAADGDTIKIKTAIDDSELQQLKKLDRLYDYAVEQSKAGKDVDLGSVNKMIQTQNYKNIADQAHGFQGVNAAIKEYNTLTDTASKNKLIETINGTNTSLGKYLTGLNGANAGLQGYATSLATATLKTFALEAATTAMNAVVSYGISFVISGIITVINDFANSAEYAKERAENFSSSIKEFQNEISNGSSKISELNSKYQELSEGVDNAGHNISLTSEQYTEYKDVVSQLSDLMPTLSTTFNEQGEKIGFVEGKLKDANKEYREYLKNKATDYFQNGDEDGNTFDDALDTYNTSKKESANFGQVTKNSFLQALANASSLGILDARDFGLNTASELTEKGQLDLLNTFKKGTNNFSKDSFLGIKTKFIPTDIDYFEDITGLDVDDLVNATDDEFEQYRETIYKKISSLEDTQELYWSQIRSSLTTELFTDDDYLNSAPKLQGNISSFVSSLSSDIFDSLNIDTEDTNAVRTYIDNIVDLFVQNKDGFTNAYSQLLNPDLKDLPVDEARKKIQHFASIIATGLGLNPNNGGIAKVQSMLGYDDWYNDVAKQYDEVVAFASNGSYGSVSNIKSHKGFDQNSVIKAMNDNGINTKDEINKFKEILKTVNSLDEAIQKYKVDTEQSNKVTKSVLPFKEVWDSLGTEGTDKQKKAAQETKDNLFELAEAGKLTVEAFKNNGGQTILDQTNLSAEEATKKVNELVEETKQLSAMRTGITSITSAYDEKKNSKNKTVSASTLESMGDTLGVSEWNEKDLKVWKNYKSVAADGTKGTKELKEAQDALATSFVNNGNYLANLTNENQAYYQSLLQEMGVTNAEQIIKQQLIINEDELTTKKIDSKLATLDLVSATDTEIEGLCNELTNLYGTSEALGLYVLKKQLSNKNALKTSDSISNLIALAKQCGLTGKAIKELQQLQQLVDKRKTLASEPMDARQRNELSKIDAAIAKQEEKVNKAANKKAKVKTSTTLGSKTNGSSSSQKGKNSGSKESKQELDWMERRVTRLNAKISLLNAQKENLFTVKKKNSNLNKQLAYTTKLINTYSSAVTKYNKKANSIKLSSSLKKLVQNGKISGSYKQLVKKYGEKKAEKIQSYQNWYDKSKSAKQSLAEAKTSKRELQQQQYQNYADLYDSRVSRAEAKESIAVGSKAKNTSVNTQIKNLQKSYQYQIKIAKLTKNKAEAERLEYELQKKITDLKVHQIENIQKDYENKISLLDNDEQDIKNQVSLMEAKGQIVTAGYYNSQTRYEKEKRNRTVEERSAVQNALNAAVKEGKIKLYSDEWYDIQSKLQTLDNTINDCDINIVENTKKLVELHDAMIDDIAKGNNNIQSEADFLAGLMGDNLTDSDTGTLTREGKGVLGTYGIGMEANESNARRYKGEVDRIQKLRDKNTKGEYASIEERDKAYEAYYQKWQDSIKGVYDYESKIIDLITNKYKAQLDYIKKIIDAKKEALSAEKD